MFKNKDNDRGFLIVNYCNKCKFQRISLSNISDNYIIKECKKTGEKCEDSVLACNIILLNRKLKKIKNERM